MFRSTKASAFHARLRPCEFHPGTDQCRIWLPGHLVHHIQARLVGQAPWGWRDAFVVALDGLRLTLRCFVEDVEFQAWHHNDLSHYLAAGSPVRHHQQYGVISGTFGLACVLHNSPLTALPAPEYPELWAAQMTGGVVNVATGYGIDLLAPKDATND